MLRAPGPRFFQRILELRDAPFMLRHRALEPNADSVVFNLDLEHLDARRGDGLTPVVTSNAQPWYGQHLRPLQRPFTERTVRVEAGV